MYVVDIVPVVPAALGRYVNPDPVVAFLIFTLTEKPDGGGVLKETPAVTVVRVDAEFVSVGATAGPGNAVKNTSHDDPL